MATISLTRVLCVNGFSGPPRGETDVGASFLPERLMASTTTSVRAIPRVPIRSNELAFEAPLAKPGGVRFGARNLVTPSAITKLIGGVDFQDLVRYPRRR